MKRLLLLAALHATPVLAAGTSVAGSKHDLSVAGPGPIRATSEVQSCTFCHVSHGGIRSSRPEPSASLRPYESTTLAGRAGAPTGASRACLSCHDGTIAVGQVVGRRIEMNQATAGGRIPGDRRSNLGTDLRRSHPISLQLQPGERLRLPGGHGPVQLDRQGQVQCTSCHDPHAEFGGTPEGKFLLASTRGGGLCATCHTPAGGSSHATSGAAPGAALGAGATFATVAEAGCAACHRSHGADTKGQLLVRGAGESDDQICLRCHAGGVTRLDLGREQAKPYNHAVGSGRHDAGEGPDGRAARLPESSTGAPRHATCVDCHDPHQASSARGSAAVLAGSLAGVWGIDLEGRRVDPARLEYQVCLKCHGDSANKPQLTGRRAPGAPARALPEYNLRLVFSPSAASAHPVAAPARAGSPSLKAPLGVGSQIRCTDCHASDDGPGADGSGPRGPHGSVHQFLLERAYSTRDHSVESPAAYALCYKCHDRDVLLSDRSTFPAHQRHVVASGVPCSACHTAHGVAGGSGTAAGNAHLIDFDTAIVQPTASGQRQYTSYGRGAGSCSVSCHGRSHDQTRY